MSKIPALSFNRVEFDIVDQRDGQPWIRSDQLAFALGYGRRKGGCQSDPPFAERSVRLLYDRHADEFTPSMTALITVPTPGGPQQIRVFSLRGCHLLAMFSRTPFAKAFRAWVLDVLEGLQGDDAPPTGFPYCPPLIHGLPVGSRSATKKERIPLVEPLLRWVKLLYADPRHEDFSFTKALIARAAGVGSYDQIPAAAVPMVRAWIKARIADAEKNLVKQVQANREALEPKSVDSLLEMRGDLKLLESAITGADMGDKELQEIIATRMCNVIDGLEDVTQVQNP